MGYQGFTIPESLVSELANERAKAALLLSTRSWTEKILSRAKTIANLESVGTIDNPQTTDVHIKRAVSEDQLKLPAQPGKWYWANTVFRVISPTLVPIGIHFLDRPFGMAFLVLGPFLTTLAYMMDYLDRYGRRR